MITKTLIEEKLNGQYENFLKYCQTLNKNFVEELTSEDFIAYRSENFLMRTEVEQLKRMLDFKEPQIIKKSSALPKTFYEFPLRKIFKIEEIALRENILIIEMGFSSRTKNLLLRNKIETLAVLLKFSLQDISDMEGFGKTTIDNLVETLKNFTQSKKKKISAENFQRAKEELDEFLRDAALKHDPQIDLIIKAFEKFSSQIQKKSSPQDLFASKIRVLPKEIKSRRVSLLLPLYNFKCGEIFNDLPYDLTISALPNWLAINPKTFDEEDMLNFLSEINFDLKTFAKKIATAPFKFKNPREFEVIRLRAQGAKLERIGNIFNITRERVRQIEVKYLQECMQFRQELKKILYILHALNDGINPLTLGDVKKFLDFEDAEIIWFLAVKLKLSTEIFSFDKEERAFNFYDGINIDEIEMLKRLPELMDERIFAAILENLAREKNYPAEILRNKIVRFYNRSGKIFYRGRLTVTIKLAYILKEKFPQGYKIADKSSYSRFMCYLKEIFDDETPFSQHNVDATIGKIGVLCDRGKYIHSDFLKVSPEIMAQIKNFIDASDRIAISYKEIFESLRSIFENTQIKNAYLMQGAIKFYKLPYTLRKDYLTKDTKMDMGKEFESFVKSRGEVTTQEIKDYFVSFKDANIMFLINRCPEVIRIGIGIFTHTSRLDLQKKDYESIKFFLNQKCIVPIHSRFLFNLFSKQFTDFMTRNKIRSYEKLYCILQYMFENEFTFSRPYISTKSVK